MKRSTPIALVAIALAILAYAAWGRPTAALAATPTATPTPVITQTVIVTDSANLRAGPGTTYKIIGAATPSATAPTGNACASRSWPVTIVAAPSAAKPGSTTWKSITSNPCPKAAPTISIT